MTATSNPREEHNPMPARPRCVRASASDDVIGGMDGEFPESFCNCFYCFLQSMGAQTADQAEEQLLEIACDSGARNKLLGACQF